MKRNSPAWSHTYAPPLALSLHASVWLGIFYLGVHLIAVIAVLDAGIPWAIRAVLVVVLGASLAQVWRRHVVRIAPQAVCALRFSGEGKVECNFVGSAPCVGRMADPPFIHPWMVLMRVRTDGGTIHRIVMARDAVSPGDFHRVRVYLRQRREP
jgi:hypothetical protein